MTYDNITLYTARVCPFAQRAAIALKEANVEHETVEIDLLNKPDWYGEINPDLKVPALTIGDEKLAESLIIIEYINDRFPDKNLLPKDPLKRARIRYFIEFFFSKFFSEYYKYLTNYRESDALSTYEKNANIALKKVNELLVQQSASGPYFLGTEYSLADIAIVPFLGRVLGFHKLALNGYEFPALKEYPRLAEFFSANLDRPSYKETFCGDKTYVDAAKVKYNIAK
ncbi:thioredoxin-like protein [Sporodiniella umbellata]|nr:thioredoxin-like protein [Sporodiniella umbellata]